MSRSLFTKLRGPVLAGIAAATALVWVASSEARVTRIVVDATRDMFGQPSYDEIIGRAWGELDPANPQNALITDIDLAPKGINGKVEYIASFLIRKPKDMSSTSGLMWHDVPNRGGNVTFSSDLFAAKDVHLLSGWQGDNAGATRLPANVDCLPPYAAPCGPAQVFPPPTPNNPNPVPSHWVKTPVLTGVTGQIFGRIINRPSTASPSPTNQPLNVMGNPIPYFPAEDNSGATLTTILHETINGVVTVGETIPNSQWKFCYGTGATFDSPGSAASLPVRVCLDGNFQTFDPAKLYQLVYTVKDPYVLGAGTAAFRDVQSFFRYEAQDDFGNRNPLADDMGRINVKWAIIRGSSQSGNFTRHFIHLGMNQDEAGRIVHEGAWPLIAGRRVANNSRWGQPDGVLELYQMGSEGPQWWQNFPDQVRGLPSGGILERCNKTRTCPKVVETFGGAEVYALKMTTSWVGTSARNDIPLPPNVRRYYLPSSRHGGGNGATTENPGPATGINCPGNNWGRGTLRDNPVPASGQVDPVTGQYLPFGLVDRIRAALRDWVMHGTPPPPSRWPTMAKKTLVEPTMKAMGFPQGIPGIPESIFKPENFVFPVFDYDWGTEYDHFDASGVPTNAPPPIRHVIKTLVPKVDADGNEVDGVPTAQVMAPLGTYLGWNITAGPGDVGYDGRPFHAGQVCNYAGGMVPFFKARAERLSAGDPRLSLEERYGTHEGYVAAVIAAANHAFNQGYLLAAGRDALIQRARDSDVLCTTFDAMGKCIDPAP